MRYPYANPSAPIYIIIGCGIFVAMAIALHKLAKRGIRVPKSAVFATLAVFFVARLVVAYITEGHGDISSFFHPWVADLNEDFFNFYMANPGTGEINYLNDYPPMFMYPLALIGSVASKLSLGTKGLYFLIRLPAMVCDIVASYYILKLGVMLEEKRKKEQSIQARLYGRKTAKQEGEYCGVSLKTLPNKIGMLSFGGMLLYLANPAMITDSAWWGQVDGITSMFIILSVYNVYLKRDKNVVIISILAMCFKLQYIFFMPALGMYYVCRLPKEKGQLFKELAKGVLIGVALFVGISLPLCISPMMNGHPFFMIQIYINQVSNYAYYTLNAPNLFGALNLNFVALPNSGSGHTIFVMIVVCLVVAISSFFGNARRKISILGAFTIITVYMFSYKMHERYMIYSLILLVVTYLESQNIKDLIVYLGFTCTQFLTIASIMAINGYTFDFSDKRLQIISIICLTLYIGYGILISQAKVTQVAEAKGHKTRN